MQCKLVLQIRVHNCLMWKVINHDLLQQKSHLSDANSELNLRDYSQERTRQTWQISPRVLIPGLLLEASKSLQLAG